MNLSNQTSTVSFIELILDKRRKNNAKGLVKRITTNQKIWFITLDEDGDLSIDASRDRKSKAIVATDTDGCYVMTKETIEETDKIKSFKHFITDLKQLSKR